MNREKAIIIFNNIKRQQSIDLEIPLNISANDLVLALNSAYDLGIDISNIKNCRIDIIDLFMDVVI